MATLDLTSAAYAATGDAAPVKTFAPAAPASLDSSSGELDYAHMAEVCTARAADRPVSLAELVDGIGAALRNSKGRELSAQKCIGELLACVVWRACLCPRRGRFPAAGVESLSGRV